MSGGRALPPSRSRLVEALCLRLLQEYPGPRRPTANQPRQVSRRRLILAAYDRVRGRLHNSRALLEGTGIQLYPLNESTLGKWFKDRTRLDEVRTLLQGRDLPAERPLAAGHLPAAATRPVTPPPRQHPAVQLPEPADTVGEASALADPGLVGERDTLPPTGRQVVLRTAREQELRLGLGCDGLHLPERFIVDETRPTPPEEQHLSSSQATCNKIGVRLAGATASHPIGVSTG
ncbi:uncharacterized protein LOC119109888 [Pollicipes pollicipes]|uniref:uncharacterized protein LOC119109888 n=1 Tax=Pollicipes pollicipes TaxID=41117 RepID=UPI001884E166|nr:uncharacterized protein LOC119109888 [Pollicipes pollicipes]